MIHHLGRRQKQNGQPPLARRVAECARQMRFSRTGGSGEHRRRQIFPRQRLMKRQVRLFDLLGCFRVLKVKSLHRLKPAELR